MTAEMKGSAFFAMVLGVRQVAGPTRWHDLLGKLSAGTRALCERQVVSSEWIAIAHPQELRQMAFEHAFDRDLQKSFDVGVAAFKEQNSRIFRIAFRLLSNELVMSKLAMVWNGSYRHHGGVRVANASSKHVQIDFVDVPSGGTLYYHAKAGVLHAAAEAIGGKKPHARVVRDEGRNGTIRADWS